jgi:chemotaxis signal transduction protein
MKSTNESRVKPRRVHHPERVILFYVSGQIFAIAAEAVQEIRSTDSLAGAALEIENPLLPKVRHTLERGRHTYYVVNACLHFHLPVARAALVLILRQLRVAVLVDRIDRMAEISALYALPEAFAGQERSWYRGLAYLDDMVIPVIDPAGFMSAQDFRSLDRTQKTATASGELERVVPS